jgi:trehalose utilization protein
VTSTRGIRLTVLTGGHDFDMAGFRRLLDATPGIEWRMLPLEEWSTDDDCDVVLFYTMHGDDPGDPASPLSWVGPALDRLVADGVGILVLHHAFFAFPAWPRWSEVIGIPDRGFRRVDADQVVRLRVAPGHPLAADLADWDICDETYLMDSARVEDGNDIALVTDHPWSMETIAWTRTVGASRVACIQSGHDASAYDDPSFRRLLGNAVRWLAAARLHE